jgi:hypothetical protein
LEGKGAKAPDALLRERYQNESVVHATLLPAGALVKGNEITLTAAAC